MTMTVVFDVDGVILDYMLFFEKYMRDKNIIPAVPFSQESDWGLTTMFPKSILKGKAIFDHILEMNNSPEYFGKIPYVKGAIKAIKSFHEKGIRIELLTSCGNNEVMQQLRKKNLKKIMPYVANITILPLGANKKEFLSKYKAGTLFFDDYEKNCRDGVEAGLDVYHVINGGMTPAIKNSVLDWNEIKDIVDTKFRLHNYINDNAVHSLEKELKKEIQFE